jgi:hypothetical protein
VASGSTGVVGAGSAAGLATGSFVEPLAAGLCVEGVSATSPSRASPVGPWVLSVMVCSFQGDASFPPEAVCGIGEVCDPAIPEQ